MRATPLDAFVPEDGRTEKAGGMLPKGTTVFQSHVAHSKEKEVDPLTFLSAYLGLTLSHPCSVLVQNLVKGDRKGVPTIYEYETIAPLPTNPRFQFKQDAPYDEMIASILKTDGAPKKYLRVMRAYCIRGEIISRSAVLRYMRGNDGSIHRDDMDPESTAPNGRAPIVTYAPGARNIVAVPIGYPRFDEDYQHLRQFWEKNLHMPHLGLRRSMDDVAMTLQVAVLGSDLRGLHHPMRRHAWYFYDTTRRFAFDKPIEYRDAKPEELRRDMPYCVGIAVVFTGTHNYDTYPDSFRAERIRRGYVRDIPHQGEVLGCAIEKGYETEVVAQLDALMAALPLQPDLPFACAVEAWGNVAMRMPVFTLRREAAGVPLHFL